MRASILLLCLSCLAAPAAAESLYRCEGEKGEISIQSDPCPSGMRQVWKREVTPDPEPDPDELAARAAARAEAERAAEDARRIAREQAEAEAREAERQREERKSQCHLAHDFQDQATALDGVLLLSEAQKQRLRDWVIETCRDPDAPRARP
ncbi:MAG TPA: DUF4124 domain-containing protein [Arenimonas sp.]|nr:DUF4124 domain-containing protein [Arenimonas sp.]